MTERKLDSRWFQEDRVAGDNTLSKAQTASTDEAIRNSTIIVRRLKRIINEDIEKTYAVAEDFDNPAWERLTIAAASERKVLRRYLKLLP